MLSYCLASIFLCSRPFFVCACFLLNVVSTFYNSSLEMAGFFGQENTRWQENLVNRTVGDGAGLCDSKVLAPSFG